MSQHYRIIYALNDKQLSELVSLYANEWWSKYRSLEQTIAAVSHSQVIVAVVDDSERLVGFSRVLTDFVFKALIFDVIVCRSVRGKSIGRMILQHIIKHEQLGKVQHFELYCTDDLMPFYRQFGFTEDVGPINLMRLG